MIWCAACPVIAVTPFAAARLDSVPATAETASALLAPVALVTGRNGPAYVAVSNPTAASSSEYIVVQYSDTAACSAASASTMPPAQTPPPPAAKRDAVRTRRALSFIPCVDDAKRARFRGSVRRHRTAYRTPLAPNVAAE